MINQNKFRVKVIIMTVPFYGQYKCCRFFNFHYYECRKWAKNLDRCIVLTRMFCYLKFNQGA